MGDHEHHLAAAAIAAASSSSMNQPPVVVFMYHEQDRQNNDELFADENLHSELSEKTTSIKRPASNDLDLNMFQNKRICSSIHRQPRLFFSTPKDSSPRFKRTYTIPSSHLSNQMEQNEDSMSLNIIQNMNTSQKNQIYRDSSEDKTINPIKSSNHLVMIIHYFPYITNVILLLFHLICYLFLAFGTFLLIMVCHLFYSQNWYLYIIQPLTFYLIGGILTIIAGTFVLSSLIGLSAHFLMKMHLYNWHIILCVLLTIFVFANVKWSTYWASGVHYQMRPQLNNTLHSAQSQSDSKSMLLMDYLQTKFSCCGVVNFQDWCISVGILDVETVDLNSEIKTDDITRLSNIEIKTKTWPGQTVPLGNRNKRYLTSERSTCTLPLSCCIQITDLKQPVCDFKDMLTNTKTDGCAPILEGFLISFEWLSKIICFVYGVLLIINIFLSFALKLLITIH